MNSLGGRDRVIGHVAEGAYQRDPATEGELVGTGSAGHVQRFLAEPMQRQRQRRLALVASLVSSLSNSIDWHCRAIHARYALRSKPVRCAGAGAPGSTAWPFFQRANAARISPRRSDSVVNFLNCRFCASQLLKSVTAVLLRWISSFRVLKSTFLPC